MTKLVKGSKEWNDAKAEARKALDAKVFGDVLPAIDDTEGHREGPVGTWNTSGTEVAKPEVLERDRYDEQVRNGSRDVSAKDQAYRAAEAGDEKVLAALADVAKDAPVAVPVPENNVTRAASATAEVQEDAKKK